MKCAILSVLIAACFLAAPAVAEDERKLETEHLVITWDENGLDEQGLAVAAERGEHFYALVKDFLGHEPEAKVMIVFHGPAEQPDGSWGYPHVDGWGRIHLYQFGPSVWSYFSAMAHEMVHVFRIMRRPHHDWFTEEGFAEFVALRVDESLKGFPWYDYPVTVVAGHWLATGEDIPLATIRDNHKKLNLPCKLQTYSLRAAFFTYLGDTYGDQTVIEFAQQKQAGAREDYQKFFGKEFSALESEWRATLSEDYKAIADADEQAARFRTQTPAQYMPVCEREKDF